MQNVKCKITNTVKVNKTLPCPVLSLRLVRNLSEKGRFPTSGNDNYTVLFLLFTLNFDF